MPAAFVATLLTLPVNAGIVIPDDPLTTAARVAPNILFILDDSGSMAWQYMYVNHIARISGGGIDSGPTGDNIGSDNDYGSDSSNANAIYDQTYVTNTLYYNPAISYQPWVRANGNLMTGGMSYTQAHSDDNHVTDADSGTTSSTVNLSNSVRTFYVPKDTANTDATYLSNALNYYRYQITGSDVVRSERGPITLTWTTPPGLPGPQSASSGGMANAFSFNLPSGITELEVTLAGGSKAIAGRGADLFVQRGGWPTTSIYDCRSRSGANNESCEIADPDAGTWYVGIDRHSNYSNVTLNVRYAVDNRCAGTSGAVGSNGWINCTSDTPTDRTVAEEQTNFATWYSYHRTRMKAAKAGASSAFRPLDSKVRVGFRTIWNRNNFNIPVRDGNDGRFVDNQDDPGTPANEATSSRSTWYRRLFGAAGSNGTPLQSALNSAGEYFSQTSADGPYGPQSAQYSCRQNFAILTTDGYWNSGTVNVGNQDNTNGSTITGPNNQSYTYSAASPYRDGFDETLADIAMKYWKSDLRTDMANNVPASTADPAFWQHMVTFGISIGLAGRKGWGSVAEVPDAATWNDPTDREDADRIDDLLHAAVNGHGAFVSASNPSEFTDGLSDALAAIAQRTSSYSNVATNSASLRTGAMIFNASYVAGTWTGDVKGYAVTTSGGVSATPAWSATVPAWGGRKVYTAGGEFPTATQRSSLARTGGPVDYPVTGTENANYIKGDQSKEGEGVGDLRRRTSLLGDIVGSSPEYVEDTNTLFVGANDGMLHAFNASNGQELFAYVPGILDMSRLRDLSRGDYTHRFFVDGPVVVSSRDMTPNKNILVGTLGRGGKGLYALDVSNPAGISSTPFLWEKTSASSNYGNLGLVLGKPILAKVSTGAPAVVLGNGVNSANDRAVLIVANLETGARIAEIDTGVGSAATPNGLSTPTGVLGPDGKTLAYVYAGDMLGNVWKFDLTDSSSANWRAIRLFTARSAGGTGNAQPITAAVAVATDPKTLKRWVFFGTGRFLTSSDAEDKTANAQSMYGIVDGNAAVDYTDMVARGLTGSGTTRTFDVKVGSALPTGKKGWYVNLPGEGERIVQDVQVESNVLVTASMVPTGDGCEAGGSGYINAVDAFTGTSTGSSYFDLNGNGTTTDDTVGGVPVGSVNYGVGMPTLPILFPGRIVVGGTGGPTGGGGGAAGGGRKFVNTWSRVTWREIRQD